MKKKSELHYELYGSSAGAGEKGYWRWAIFAGREKKPIGWHFLWNAAGCKGKCRGGDIPSEGTNTEAQGAFIKVIPQEIRSWQARSARPYAICQWT